MQTNNTISGVIDRIDMEDFPIRSKVKTLSGRVDTVVKHRGAQSRHDLFQRIIIEFDELIGYSVALQSHLLKLIKEPSTSSRFKIIKSNQREEQGPERAVKLVV